MQLWVEATCEMAHRVEDPIGVPRLHGHSYWVRVYIQSDVDQLVSAIQVQADLKRHLVTLDHSLMNDTLETGTMEEFARWVAKVMSGWKPIRVSINRKSLGVGVDYFP
jgi:6-pyruvoyl-tetrahydropterin synthase